jgi:hypothetical protein
MLYWFVAPEVGRPACPPSPTSPSSSASAASGSRPTSAASARARSCPSTTRGCWPPSTATTPRPPPGPRRTRRRAMPDAGERRYLVTAAQIRAPPCSASSAWSALLLVILLLPALRPQGRVRAPLGQPARAAAGGREAKLSGFELREDGGARIDIDHAIRSSPSAASTCPSSRAAWRRPPPSSARQPTRRRRRRALPGRLRRLPPGHRRRASRARSRRSPATSATCTRPTGPHAAHDPVRHRRADRGPGRHLQRRHAARGRLSDDEIAALANHVMTAWATRRARDAFEPYAPDEIAEWRAPRPLDGRRPRARVQLTLP